MSRPAYWFFLHVFPGYAYDRKTGRHTCYPGQVMLWAFLIGWLLWRFS